MHRRESAVYRNEYTALVWREFGGELEVDMATPHRRDRADGVSAKDDCGDALHLAREAMMA